ncbi:MAG: cell wall anchor protein [Opitutaceae bacterium]|jgi:hypothetical protein|nr:cell wall anchor protein [Opitutaceae bacterium]
MKSPNPIIPVAVLATAAFTVAIALLATPVTTRADFAPLSDSFDGSALDAETWTSAKTSSSGSVSVNDGKLLANVGSTGSTQRSLIISTRKDFDPFAQALTFSFSDLSISGTPATTGANVFYALVGNIDTDAAGDGTSHNYRPGTGPANGTGYLSVVVAHYVDVWKILLYTNASSSQSFTISGAPTSFTWTVDGTSATPSWTLSLDGATFSDGESNKSGAYSSVTHSLFTTNGSYLAIGAYNLTANTDAAGPTGISLGAVDVTAVTAVPEPAAVAGLLGMGCLTIALGCRHLRRL